MYPLAPATATRRVPTPATLPLAVLELLPRAGLTVLLPLARQRAGEPVPDGSRLARRPAALHGHQQIELPHGVRDGERLRDDHAQRLAREIVLERALVDDDASGPGLDPHASDRRLAPSGAV